MADPKQPGDGGDDFSDSDWVWWNRLSGRSDGPADIQASDHARAAREAEALKRALAHERAAADTDPSLAAALSPEARERRMQQLQFRLRREGLDTPAAPARPAWQRRTWIGAALAAGVVASVLVVSRFGGETIYYDEPPVIRGEIELVRVAAEAPKKAADDLLAALLAAGAPAAIYQSKKVFFVDIAVTAATPETALDLLRRAGAKAQPGRVRIEFAPR